MATSQERTLPASGRTAPAAGAAPPTSGGRPALGGVSKPGTGTVVRGKPMASKAKAILRKALASGDFKTVPIVLKALASGQLEQNVECAALLERALKKMGRVVAAQEQRAIKLRLMKEEEEKQSKGKLSTSSDVPDKKMVPTANAKSVTETPSPSSVDNTAVGMDVDMRADPVEEEEEDLPIDYRARLESLIAEPSVTEELLVPRRARLVWSQSLNMEDRKLSVRLRLRMDPPKRLRSMVGQELSTEGTARLLPRHVRDARLPVKIARNRAAKDAYVRLSEIVRKIESIARKSLHDGLKALFDEWRDEKYVDKCYKAYKRAEDIVLNSTYDGLYGAKAWLYGSCTTGLILGDSDIDVAVSLPITSESQAKPYEQQDRRAEVLYFLKASALKKNMSDPVVIPNAKVPVMRYRDDVAGVDVDVTLTNDKAILLSRLFRSHLKEDVRVWELCMAVKYWAKRRKVSGTPQQHINPMGWTIMAIYFLQHHVSPRLGVLYQTSGEDSSRALITAVPWTTASRDGECMLTSGELLTRFFDFYAKFPYGEEAISLNLRAPTTIEGLTSRGREGALFIEQPLEPGVNVVGYVPARNLEIAKKELRRAHAECVSSGLINHIFARRHQNEEETLFHI